MNMIPVTSANSNIYIDLGIRSYREHYLHLWMEADPSPYIESNFTDAIVENEIQNPNLAHFIIQSGDEQVGIIKIVKDAGLGIYSDAEALLLEKIYLLTSYSGRGLGKLCIDFVMNYAKQLGKKGLWLDTMKNGRALSFYLDLGFQIVGQKDLSYSSVLEDQKPMYILLYDLEHSG